ncbi:MAG: SURF1 family cytochrome oxidase biogenesis protein, partial [Pseudomonadota bacterium]
MLKNKDLLIPTLMTLTAVVTTLILGFWQVSRLQQKNLIINNLQIENDIEFPGEISDLSSVYNKIYNVTGKFIHDKEVHLYSGKYQSKYGEGYQIVTPFLINDSKKIVMVKRGWVKKASKEISDRPETISEEQVTLSVLVTEPPSARWFFPDNDINNNLWIWLDIN